MNGYKVQHDRSDTIIDNRKTLESIIIDVIIQICKNVVQKETWKNVKYRDLEVEQQ